MRTQHHPQTAKFSILHSCLISWRYHLASLPCFVKLIFNLQIFSGHQLAGLAQQLGGQRVALLERRAGLFQTKMAPKFEEHVERFLEWSAQQHRPKTRELHGTNCGTLLRFFRGHWLDEINAGMVEDFKLVRAKEAHKHAVDERLITPATVNRALTTMKKLFNHVEKCGYHLTNPPRRVAFLNEGSGRVRVVDFREEIAYLANASQPLKDIAQVILDTGLRPEEVFRLRLENIDFLERTIFNPFGKTKAARRKVAMTGNVFDLLKKRARTAEGPSAFPSRNDRNIAIRSVRKAHDAALERAGIKEHFRLYDLRHTFATRAVTAGVDLSTLSFILGHTNIQMTMRYVHPAEEQKRVAVGKLETYRLAQIVEAVEKSRVGSTISATVQ
jgi:integrase